MAQDSCILSNKLPPVVSLSDHSVLWAMYASGYEKQFTVGLRMDSFKTNVQIVIAEPEPRIRLTFQDQVLHYP